MTYLAVAHIAAVKPYIKAGIHPLKMQIGPGSTLIPLIAEITDIGTARVILRNIGRIKGKGIADIGVLR